MKRVPFYLLMMLVTAALSCTTYNVVTPVYPKTRSSGGTPVVDSLQPTFKWEYKGEGEYTYDLVIHEILINKEDLNKEIVGDVIYYRDNLPSPEHRIEEALAPDREYCWAVRLRKDDKVSSWSRYNEAAFIGVGVISKTNVLFKFKTPAAADPQ